MQEKPPQLVSVAFLIRMASLYTAGSLPCNYQSYPIAYPVEQGLWVAFLYADAQIIESQQGLCVKPPRYIAFFSAQTGRFQELRQFLPQKYGLPATGDQYLGRCLTPAERMAPEFLTAQIKLLQCYDDLLSPFAAGRPAAVDAETAAASTEFKKRFDQLAEKPLMPYYKRVGKPFFAWLDGKSPAR